MKYKQEDLDSLRQKIDYLENKLEKVLSSKNSLQAIQVTGALKINQIKILQVSLKQLVNIYNEQQENSRVFVNDLFALLNKIENEVKKNSQKNWQLESKYNEQFKIQSEKLNNVNNGLKIINRNIKDLQSSQAKLSKLTKIFVGLGTTLAFAAAVILHLGNRQINQLNANSNQLQNKINQLQNKITTLEDSIGRNIVNLLQEKKITVKAVGTGITRIELEICPNTDIEHRLTVLIPAGSFFDSNYEKSQSASELASLVSTKDESIILTRDKCSSLTIPSLATSLNKKFPKHEDALLVRQKYWHQDIKNLINLIANNPTQLNDFESMIIQQAAVLILTENTDYESLEQFDSFVPFSQNIDYVQTISPNQTLNGQC